MAWIKRNVDEPFDITFGASSPDNAILLEFYTGEALLFQFDEQATMVIAAAPGSTPLFEEESDGSGVLALSIAEADATIPTSTTRHFYVWNGPTDDPRVRAFGQIRALVSVVTIGVALPWLLETGNWDDAGVWDDAAIWSEA